MPHSVRERASFGWSPESCAPLTWDDLDVVAAFVHRIAPDWSAELNQTCAEESSIVVLPEGANDLIGPAFVLHRTHARVHLDQFRWDAYRKLGAFATMEEALTVLRAHFLPLVSPSRSPSAFTH